MSTATVSEKPSPAFRFNKLGTGSFQLDLGLLIFGLVVLALLAQWFLLDSSDLDGNLTSRLKPPGFTGRDGIYHIFGTDQLGRDLLFRVLGGLPWSLGISGVAVVCVAVIGTFIGLIGAWYTGIVRTIVLLGVASMIAMPFLVLALVVVAVVGRGFWPISLTMGFIAWTAVSRVIYAESRGASHPRIRAGRAVVWRIEVVDPDLPRLTRVAADHPGDGRIFLCGAAHHRKRLVVLRPGSAA